MWMIKSINDILAVKKSSYKRFNINAIRNLAILLIEAGLIGLVYTNFSYTKQTEGIKAEAIEKSVKEKQTVQVPIWAGSGAIVLGGLLLIFGNRRS